MKAVTLEGGSGKVAILQKNAEMRLMLLVQGFIYVCD
jgi:hypothetical protein